MSDCLGTDQRHDSLSGFVPSHSGGSEHLRGYPTERVPEHWAAKQAEKAAEAAADAAYQVEVRKRAADAEAELSSAGIALFQIRSTAPLTVEEAEEFRVKEIKAEKRYESAQLAVNGPNWRAKQDADRANLADMVMRQMRQAADRVEARQAEIDMTMSMAREAAARELAAQDSDNYR